MTLRSCAGCNLGGGGGTGAGGMEVLSVLLGLLINLVEDSAANCAQLVVLDLGGGAGAPAAGAPPGGVLPLLCRMISSSTRSAERQGFVAR